MVIERVTTANNLNIEADHVYTLHEEELKVFVCQGRLLYTDSYNKEIFSVDIRTLAQAVLNKR